MGFRIKLANTAKELDELFVVRHKFYVQENRIVQPTEDRRIFDRFDAMPTSANFVAMDGTSIIGGLRVCLTSEVGTPADEYFDVCQHIPDGIESLASMSLFCLLEEYRDAYGVGSGLTLMATYWAAARGASHAYASINPMIGDAIRRIGWKPVAPIFRHEKSGLDVQPMIINMTELNSVFMKFIDSNELMAYVSSFDHLFFRKGEFVVRKNETGSEAYLIVDGKASVRFQGGSEQASEKTLYTLGNGEIVGELALLAEMPRTADVVAETDLDVMALDRTVFQDQILANPKHSKRLLRSLAKRLRETMQKLVEQESLAAIGQFASGLVHEIRSPLSTISMALQRFEQLDLPQTEKKRLALAENEALRMERLMSEILLYARPLHLKLEPLALISLITETIELVREAANHSQCEYRFPTDLELIVMADADKLRQVLINLMRNACDAAPAGSEILIDVRPCDDIRTVRVLIHNEGKPIPADLLPRLMDPFFSTKPRGTGLGLAITNRIVTAHEGVLSITSTLDEGTTVDFTLPLSKQG